MGKMEDFKMTKADLINAVAAKAEITKKDADKAVAAVHAAFFG